MAKSSRNAAYSSAIRLDGDWIQLPCACANVRRLARLATRVYDEELRPVGMEVGQFGLTATIARLGPVSQAQLARGVAMDQTSLTRTLAVLQKRGWIQKRIGTDRRARLFAVTAKGLAQLERARPLWRRAQDRFRKAVGADVMDAFTASVEHAALSLEAELTSS